MNDEFEKRGLNDGVTPEETDFFGNVEPLGAQVSNNTNYTAVTQSPAPVEETTVVEEEQVTESVEVTVETVSETEEVYENNSVNEEAPVAEVLPEVEASPIVVKEEVVPVEIDFEKYQAVIDTHFAAVRNLLKYNKEKDANLSKLSSELQRYRDGYQLTLFKSIAMSVIGYREDCRKSLRDYEERELTREDACKYIKYLRMDFEDLLENLGIEVDGEEILYNGKNVNKPATVPVVDETIPEIFAQDIPEGVITSVEDIAAYLGEAEKAIAKTIADYSILDKLMARYIENAKAYEYGVWQVVLYPVIRKIAKAYVGLKNRTDALEETITAETGKGAYLGELAYMVYQTEQILYLCGISIDGYVSDTFDLKKHRLLKTLFTDKEELNGVVAVKHTECYMLDDRVLYPAKVEVYKFKA